VKLKISLLPVFRALLEACELAGIIASKIDALQEVKQNSTGLNRIDL
jgi:hypothetical protein